MFVYRKVYGIALVPSGIVPCGIGVIIYPPTHDPSSLPSRESMLSSRTRIRPSQDNGADAANRTTVAYQRLREAIVHGQLAPGARIVETEVAERLGISRTPVRAALQRLHQEGYIVSLGKASARPQVAPLTLEDARELFGIVAEIEGLAARWAAGQAEKEREALADLLRRINDEYFRVAREDRPEPSTLFDLDTRFHRTYVEAGAGPRLLKLHDAIKPQAERYIRLYISALTDEIATSVVEHNVIVAAIGEGDPEGSQLAVQTNWRNAAERLSRVIHTLGERGSW
jgi:DNA-binding GntR family transcriptional regulator